MIVIILILVVFWMSIQLFKNAISNLSFAWLSSVALIIISSLILMNYFQFSLIDILLLLILLLCIIYLVIEYYSVIEEETQNLKLFSFPMRINFIKLI